MSKNHALIFGGSGLIGWGVVNEILSNYPSPETFSRVTVAVNRPCSDLASLWPPQTHATPQLAVISGVNLRDGTEEDLAGRLREGVREVESVTHVFYFVFTAIMEDSLEECRVNCAMMERVAGAVNIVAPSLKAFVYSGGTRGYGIYLPGGTFTPPLKESMADHLPPDYAQTVAYPHFRRILTESAARAGRSWTWTEICPDAVVGFTPGGSAFSLALHWAQYLSLYGYVNGAEAGTGEGAKEDEVTFKPRIAFPGVKAAYHASFTPTSTETLGRISIHAALHQKECAGKVLNAADRARPTSWEELWPQIVGWFGMLGVGPSDESLAPSEYVEKYRHLFQEHGLNKAAVCGVGAGSKQLDNVGSWLSFDRQLSLERLKSVGFDEEVDPARGWTEAFRMFREAGLIL